MRVQRAIQQIFRWRRKNGDAPARLSETELRDQRLSAYLDGDWDALDTPALQSELAGDPGLLADLEGLRMVRDALAGLEDVRAPRPFTLAAPPRAVPAPTRLEFATRIATVTAALLLAVLLVGDLGRGAERAADSAAGGVAMEREALATAPVEPAAETARSLAAPAAPAEGAAATPEAGAAAQADEGQGKAGLTPPTMEARAPEAAPAPRETGTTAPAGDTPSEVAPTVEAGDRGLITLSWVLFAVTGVLAAAALAQWAARRGASRRLR